MKSSNINMQTAVTLILAAVFVATECRSPPIEPFHDFCYANLNQCTLPLQQNAFIAGASTDYRVLIENVDGICETYSQVAVCGRSNLHYCSGEMRQYVTAGFQVADFLCSAEGKSLLAQYKESQCYNNPMIIFQAQRFVQDCAVEVGVRPHTPGGPSCQETRAIIDCIQRKVTEACGDAAGRIVAEVGDIMYPFVTNNRCSTNIIDEFVRSVRYALKR